MKRMILVQQEIAKKYLKKLCRFINAVFQVILVRPYQCISKIPCIFGKNIVCDIESQRAKIFNEKYCCRSGIALTWFTSLVTHVYRRENAGSAGIVRP